MQPNWRQLLGRTIIVTQVLFASSLWAQTENLGSTLRFDENSRGRYEVTGTYEMSQQSYTWHLQFHSRLTMEEIAAFPEDMYYNFWDTVKGRYIGDWRPMKRNQLRRGYFFEHSPRVLFQLLPNMSHVVMVFSIKGFSDFEPQLNINLGILCGTRGSSYISHSSDPEQDCANIDTNDLPNSPAACVELRRKFDDWRAQRYVSCKAAQDMDYLKGCDLATGTRYRC